MKRRPGIRALIAGGGLGILLAVAGARAGEKETVVDVSLGEWSVRPARATVKPGSVNFTVTNDGTTDHQFVVIKTERAPDALVVDEVTYNVVEAATGTLVGKIGAFRQALTESRVYELPVGKYVLICNLPAHFRQGMRAAFNVD